MIWAILKLSEPILLCIVISSTVLAKPRGRRQNKVSGSLEIATRQRELERKRLAELHHHGTGRFFSALLSHSLLMFFSAFQSGGCRDILSLGRHYKELPKSGLAGCPPACHRLTFYTFLTDGCVSPPGGCAVREYTGDGLNWGQ